MTKFELPEILGMRFMPSTGDCQAAPLNPEFWIIYVPEKEALRAVGVTVGTDDGGAWRVIYNPRFDPTAGAVALLLQLDIAYAPKVYEERELKAAAEREAEIRQENAKRDYELWLEGNAESIQRTIERAKSLQYAYGESVKDKVKIATLLSLPINRSRLVELDRLTMAAERKIAASNDKYSDKSGGVECPDEVVIEAVEILTGLDDDHAEERNGIGWSAGHSSAGHWCHGALKDPRYRQNALKLARVLVASYINQLAKFMPGVDLGNPA